MEKEFVTITNDGRLIQKDTSFFAGKELAKIEPEHVGDAVRYFSNNFKDLSTYVASCLRTFEGQDDKKEVLERLSILRKEVISANAAGDFDSLVAVIDAAEEGFSGAIKKGETLPAEYGEKSGAEQDGSGEKSEAEQDGSGEKSEAEQDGSGEVAEIHSEKVDDHVSVQPEEVTDMQAGGKAEQRPQEVVEKEEVLSYSESLAGFAELVKQAHDLSHQNNWQFIQSELENIRFKWEEMIEADGTLAEEAGYHELIQGLDAADKRVSERKAAWIEKRRERRKQNLDKREGLLDQLQAVVDQKKWQAIKRVNSIINKWEEIRDLPKDDSVAEQEKKFEALVGIFNEKKIAYLVKKARKEEENLAGKLAIIDKLSQIVAATGPNTADWQQRDKEVEELSRQWRKIGHVPMEQSESTWERFKAVRDDYFIKKMEFNKKFRNEITKNIQKKTRLCEAAEALIEDEDLATAVREINVLHKNWKKIGMAPKEKNDELWERFNEATRKLNDRKNENQELIKQQEEHNLDKKTALCEKMEEYSNRKDWNAATRDVNELLNMWKDAGPVPRRKTGKLWNRFKTAMDTFFAHRRAHYKSVREEQKKNLEKKNAIIVELVKIGAEDNPSDSIERVKELQEEFRKTGFVPIKRKEKTEIEYKQACDIIYQKIRSGDRNVHVREEKKPVDSGKSTRAEYFKLKKECDSLHDEIMRYRDTKTFINPGGKGNALIDEIQQKIEKSEKVLEKKLEHLETLRQNM